MIGYSINKYVPLLVHISSTGCCYVLYRLRTFREKLILNVSRQVLTGLTTLGTLVTPLGPFWVIALSTLDLYRGVLRGPNL